MLTGTTRVSRRDMRSSPGCTSSRSPWGPTRSVTMSTIHPDRPSTRRTRTPGFVFSSNPVTSSSETGFAGGTRTRPRRQSRRSQHCSFVRCPRSAKTCSFRRSRRPIRGRGTRGSRGASRSAGRSVQRGRTSSTLRAWTTSPSGGARPTADGALAGVIMAARNPSTAVIAFVGVVPEQRGRGLARDRSLAGHRAPH